MKSVGESCLLARGLRDQILQRSSMIVLELRANLVGGRGDVIYRVGRVIRLHCSSSFGKTSFSRNI